jgi:hypothetical protein
MKLDKDIVQNALSGDLQALYRQFYQVLEEYPEDERDELYNQVRNGILIKFDIYDLFKERIQESGDIVVVNDPESNETCEISAYDYNTELEKRENIIIKCILGNMENDQTIKGHSL